MPDTTDPVLAPKTRGPYSKNDQRIAAEITAADRFLETVRTDADIQPVALEFGIDAEELDQAAALVADAAKKWGVRLEGMSAEDETVEQTSAALDAVHDDYMTYREIGRANFPSAADRTALGLSGDVPAGFNALMLHIRAAYEAAKKPPYTATFAKRSYTPAKLDTLLAAVDALVDDEAGQTKAEGAAIKTTEERDAAYQKMKAAMKPIKGTLKGALRGQPALLAKLGM